VMCILKAGPSVGPNPVTGKGILVEKSSRGTPTLEYDRVKISGVPILDFSTSSK
jgi:hypothetical protein